MRLASETEIVIGHETITLRPSLRAAHALDQKYGGFDRLFEAVAGGSLTAISDVIKHGSGGSTVLTRYLDTVEGKPLGICIESLTPQLAAFIYELAGIDPQQTAKPGKPIPFADYHLALYRIAAGWLGWTPQQAWDATPAEIIEAQRGRMDMLGAIFGNGESNGADQTEGMTATTRDRLNAIGNLTNVRVP